MYWQRKRYRKGEAKKQGGGEGGERESHFIELFQIDDRYPSSGSFSEV